ncbi:tRNA (cmo5U34)-methyltransferase [Nocardiopsis mwathae]|uniref:tRNA (Cmo5U34)-methyltransferase n=1 Tax=Nocardiopsis mwathae TaxID=1472723 RepID=A0A7W9YMJ3_9ACTN|nr:class I SAM-dependent methyltransferase [Nocardiopsis mwathae]MBB6174734.1 tRNA (cmo5U34)-methyltransferase [Nocardiopsis mwathae]
MAATSEPEKELWNPGTYDRLRRQLIPSFDLLYRCAVRAVAMTTAATRRPRVLDLGAGTGLLSAAIVQEIPDAEIVMLDRSEAMLAQATARFAAVVGDLTDPLPEGRFDAVVSALAIHHLPHGGKRDLFGRVLRQLDEGGVFVNVEQVLAPTDRLERMYDEQHERHVQESRTPAEEWAAGRERMKFDIPIDVATQLQWLRDAGFAEVDCLAKDWRFATYAGWKH